MPTPTTLPAPTPSRAAEFLGPPPLNPGDDRAGYDTLIGGLVAEVAPRGVIEEACVREVADTIWDGARLRRHKAKLMTVSADRGLREVLETIGVQYTDAKVLAKGWAARQLDAVGEVDRLLDAAGLDIHHVMAKTLEWRLDQVERIDRMIAGAEARRAAMLREIVLYRDPGFAGRLRRAAAAADKVTDGEFAEVPVPQAAVEAAAAAAVAAA
jgi:hypothetical protein